MTNQDQTAQRDRGKAGHRAPAASLQKVSIRRGPRPSVLTDPVELPASPGIDAPRPDIDSTSTVIEIRAERTEQVPSRTFPSVQPQSAETFGATATGRANVSPSAIIDLWEHLAADRLRPGLSDIDPVTIAGQWPNSLLLRVTQGGRRPGLEVAHMFTPPPAAPHPPS